MNFPCFARFAFIITQTKKKEGTFNTKSIVKWHKTNVNGKCHPIFTAKKNDLAIKILMFDISKENIFNFIQSTFLPHSLSLLLSTTSVSFITFSIPRRASGLHSLHVSRKQKILTSGNFHLTSSHQEFAIVIPLKHFWL